MWRGSALSRRPSRRTLLWPGLGLLVAVIAAVSVFVAVLQSGGSGHPAATRSVSAADVDTSCCPQADDDLRTLVARYSPVLLIGRDDFAPIEVQAFLNEPGRLGQKPDRCVTQISPRPSELGPDNCPTVTALLAGSTTRPRMSVIGGGDLSVPASYLTLYGELTKDYAQVTYSEVRTLGTAVSIDYWFFYLFDYYTNNLGNHEGDWERVQVRIAATSVAEALKVDPSRDAAKLSVAYSRHRCDSNENMPTRTWDVIDHEGAHPLVYVAAGSHANYFDAGEDNRQPATLVDGPCFLGSAGDTTPAQLRITPSPVLIDCAARRPGWTAFAGGWGLEGPRGPCFHH